MRARYRIVKLYCGKYAIERRLPLLGWELKTIPHPDVSGLVQTYDSIDDAENSFRDPMEVIEIVKEL